MKPVKFRSMLNIGHRYDSYNMVSVIVQFSKACVIKL